jgi:hypothetical protein
MGYSAALARWWGVGGGVVLAVVLAGCSTARVGSPAPRQDDLAALCANIDNSYECAQAIERHQLKKSDLARQATRNGKTLRLQLSDGKSVAVTDSQPGDETSIVKYSFRDHLHAVGYYLLHRQYYEGEDYVMVHDRTGQTFPLPGVPVISPDKARLVTALAGLSGGYGPNTVQVWRFGPAGLTREFATEPKEWEATGATWSNNSTIRLETRTVAAGDATPRTRTVTLRLRDNAWTVDDK